jgi:hypothetical protein
MSLNRAFRACDLDDPVSRISEGHLGNDVGNVVSRDRLKQAHRQPDDAPIRTRIGDSTKEFQELGQADDRVGDTGSLDQFLLGDLAR